MDPHNTYYCVFLTPWHAFCTNGNCKFIIQKENIDYARLCLNHLKLGNYAFNEQWGLAPSTEARAPKLLFTIVQKFKINKKSLIPFIHQAGSHK